MSFAEMRRFKKPAGIPALLVAMCLLVQSAWADTFNYADVDAGNLLFSDISETNDSTFPLFGPPELLEEVLFLQGTGFQSNTTNSSFDFVQGVLSMTIEADPGTVFDSIQVEEFGSYFVFGDDSAAVVSTQGFVEANGEFYFGEMTFDSLGGNGVWDSSFTISFPETDRINLLINSQIFSTATSGSEQVAFIDKSGTMITVGGRSAVPEPGNAAMLILASGLIATIRRRKN